MKTAISIPDNVYNAAEQLAGRLGESRSELYSKAVSNYINQHQDVKVTDKLNAVYATETLSLDPIIANLQDKVWLNNNPW